MTVKRDDIHAALNGLMRACGLSGESGTEQLYDFLADTFRICEHRGAIRDAIQRSHDEGLCLDVNAMLADRFADSIIHRMMMGD